MCSGNPRGARHLLFATVVVAVLGCRPRPSPEYEEAHQRFSRLYAVHLDGAYARPEMDRVVSLLQRVPPQSLDAAAARDLLARIEAGRAQLAHE